MRSSSGNIWVGPCRIRLHAVCKNLDYSFVFLEARAGFKARDPADWAEQFNVLPNKTLSSVLAWVVAVQRRISQVGRPGPAKRRKAVLTRETHRLTPPVPEAGGDSQPTRQHQIPRIQWFERRASTATGICKSWTRTRKRDKGEGLQACQQRRSRSCLIPVAAPRLA